MQNAYRKVVKLQTRHVLLHLVDGRKFIKEKKKQSNIVYKCWMETNNKGIRITN